MASGAPARAVRKRLQFRHAEFQAARPRGSEARPQRRQFGDDGFAGDDAHQRQPYRRNNLIEADAGYGFFAPASGGDSFGQNRNGGFNTRPAGNSVNLEDQMLKVSANQMDYAAATSLYSRSLGLLKTAIGKR